MERVKAMKEVKGYRKLRIQGYIYRRSMAVTLMLVLCVVLSGCNSTKLADGFDEDTIIETAEEIINEVQMNGAKQVLAERMREDFLENIDLDTMENTVVNLTKGKGNFLTYGEESVIGRYHEEAKEDFGVILVTAKYEKGEINYTISFDKNMKVVGFYAKE